MPRATAPDIMTAVAALLQGLTENIYRSRAEQTRGLQLLAQQPGYSIAPDPDAVPAHFLRQLIGQAYEPGPGGTPVVPVGGLALTARRAPDLRYAAPTLFEGETALPAALQQLYANQPATPQTFQSLAPYYINQATRREAQTIRAGEREEDEASRALRELRALGARREERTATEAAAERRFERQETGAERRLGIQLQREETRATAQEGRESRRGRQALRQHIVDKAQAAGVPAPEALNNPDLSTDELFQVLQALPPRRDRAGERQGDKLMTELDRIRQSIVRQLAGGTDPLSGLRQKALPELPESPEKAEREATIRTLRQHGRMLAMDLAKEPGYALIAAELLKDFEVALEPSPALPAPPPPPSSGFRWPWEPRTAPLPTVKGFRQIPTPE